MIEIPSLVVKSKEEHIVMGVVYAPLSIDVDNETMLAENICKMAYDFLATGKVNNIDVSHNFRESGCVVVESFIAREGDSAFSEGSWVLVVKITDDIIWAKVLKGELNAFSFAGPTKKETVRVLVEALDTVKGDTEDSTVDIIPPHKHSFFLKFNDSGNIIAGKTAMRMGHVHKVRFPGATEIEMGHAHRIVLS